MPLDGVVVRNIVQELSILLTNGKIDKISQPEKDEVILTIRNNGRNFKLLLSASPNYPRVHLTDINKQNPIDAPMFCMVLRKHLSGGKILRFNQYNLDRIIEIFIESYDELGSLSTKVLICEIMGRRSNITLVSESSYTIIDSIKRLTAEMNSYRQVLPGVIYRYPPMQDKLEPLDLDMGRLSERIDSAPPGTRIGKFISNNINGFSAAAAAEICHNAEIDRELEVGMMNDSDRQRLIDSVSGFIFDVKSNRFNPCVYLSDSSVYDFYSFKLGWLNNLAEDMMPDISRAIEYFYGAKDRSDRARQKSSDLYRVVSNNLTRCYKKLSMQQERLMECSHKEKWRLYGDLIMANLYNIKKGDTKAVVANLYDQDLAELEIPLDMLLSPVENAQHYYRKYNKEKTAESMTEKQKEENLQEIQYLESLLVTLENCSEDDEIDEIRSELAASGYIKRQKKYASRKKAQSKPLHYVSSEGNDIYVGKNNLQNDYLTTRFAEPNDIWLHTKNIPGSHVIIKANNKPVNETTIIEASHLAAYFSKARDSSNIPVDYTERKNVKKPSGAKPGMVIYYTNRTMYITPDGRLINNMMTVG